MKKFVAVSSAILIGWWLCGREIDLLDLFISVAASCMYCLITSLEYNEIKVVEDLMLLLLTNTIFSPLCVLDWNVKWKEWPFPSLMGMSVGLLLISMKERFTPKIELKQD
jgi:hypothetical protein